MSSKKKRVSYYPVAPRNIGPHQWCYIEPKGLCVVVALGGSGAVVLPKHIPWKLLRSAVDLHRRIERQRRGKA